MLLNSVIIIVQSSAQLSVIRQKLESDNLTVENAHPVDLGNEDDFLHVNGYDNNDDDSSEEEEEGEDSDTSADGDNVVTKYVIKLPTLDALSAVVLLNSDIEGIDTCRADFAYMEQIGYKVKDGVRKLKYVNLSEKNLQVIWKKDGSDKKYYFAPTRTPYQTFRDDCNKTVGIMCAIYRVYTPQQIYGVNSIISAEVLSGIQSSLPNEFYHRYEGYSHKAWGACREFYTTEGFDVHQLLANARQTLSSTAVTDTNTRSTFHSVYNMSDGQLLESFDSGMLKQTADDIRDSLFRPNEPGVSSVAKAKKPYAVKIGLNNNVMGLLDLLSLDGYDMVTNNFSPAKDAAIYISGTTGGNINNHLHDCVCEWSVKSLAIKYLIDACVSNELWNHSPVKDMIVAILDDGESGDLYLFSRIVGQQAYTASIINRADISDEATQGGQIYKVFRNAKHAANAANANNQASAADTGGAGGDDEEDEAEVAGEDNNESGNRRSRRGGAAVTYNDDGIGSDDEEEDAVAEDDNSNDEATTSGTTRQGGNQASAADTGGAGSTRTRRSGANRDVPRQAPGGGRGSSREYRASCGTIGDAGASDAYSDSGSESDDSLSGSNASD